MAEEILIQFGEKGAGIVIDKIKKVQKSVDQLKSDMKSPLGPTLDAKMFSTAAVDKAAVSLNHLGVEYDRVKSKMKSPLGVGNDMLNAKNFSPSAIRGLNNELQKTGDVAKNAGFQLGFVSRILAAMAIRAVAREVLQLADAFTTLQNRLKTVSDVRDVSFIGKELFQTAQDARVSLESVVTMYSRTRRAVQDLGKSQLETMKFTDALAKAVTVGGSTAMEASNAMIQLSQGMGSGALRGDELRSVLEQLPIVAELIAKKMGRPISALRSLGAEGALTTQVVFDAITENADYIEEKLSKMDLTVGQAFTRLKNQATVAAEGMQGAMKHLADAIQWVTNNFDTMITVMEGLLFGVVALAGARGIQALVTQVKLLNAATSANKIVMLATAVATVSAALAPFVWQLRVAEGSVVTFGDVTKAMWDELRDTFNGSDGPEKKVEELTNDMYKLSEGTKQWVNGIATALDYFTNILPVVQEIKAAIAFFRGTDSDTMFRDAATKIIARTDANKQQEMVRDALKQQRDLEAQKRLADEDYAARLARKYQKDKEDREKGKGSPESGKTLSEIIGATQFQHDLGMMADPMEVERIKMMKEALDSLKPSIRAAIEAGSPAYDKQLNQLDELIRMEIARKAHQDDRIKAEEEANKRIDKQLEELRKEDERRNAANKKAAKEIADRFAAKTDKNKDIAASLDSNSGRLARMAELQEFTKSFDALPEQIQVARKEIKLLKADLITGGAASEWMKQVQSVFGPGGVISKGFADITARGLVMNKSLRETKQLFIDLLDQVGVQILSSAIQFGINAGLGALGASSGGFASGGYTGGFGTNQVAGVVHGQEFVLNADATRKIGLGNLQHMNATGSVPKASAPQSAAQPNVVVHNYAGVQVETALSEGQVQVMINKAVKDQVPGLVASAVTNPNSMVSKSLQRHLTAERRRGQ